MVPLERLQVRLVFAVLRRQYSTRSSGIVGRGLQPFFEYNGSVPNPRIPIPEPRIVRLRMKI